MSFGLTTEGFNLKRLEDIKLQIEQEIIASFGEVNLNADGVFGQLVGIVSNAFAEYWMQMELVYYSQYINTAEGTSLDNAVSLVGVKRLEATKSSVIAAITGDEGTGVPLGSQVSVDFTGEVFESLQAGIITRSNSVVIEAAPNVATASANYTVVINGTSFVHNAGATPTLASINTGIINAINSGTEPVTATDLGSNNFKVSVDDFTTVMNVVVSSNITINSRTSPLSFTAVDTGPIQVLPGTFIDIVTPIAGWDSVTNFVSGVLGRDRETDIQLRERSAESLRVVGSGSVEAVQARLRQNITGVTSALVFENRTSLVDAQGRPSHSFESVISGGDATEIATAIWQNKPAGIQTYGNESVNITDSNGDTQQISFSRPQFVYIWANIALTVSAGVFPIDGVEAVKKAFADYGSANFSIGDKIIYQQFFGPMYEVAGILDINLQLGKSSDVDTPPSSYAVGNVVIAQTEVAVFDINQVSVTIV